MTETLDEVRAGLPSEPRHGVHGSSIELARPAGAITVEGEAGEVRA